MISEKLFFWMGDPTRIPGLLLKSLAVIALVFLATIAFWSRGNAGEIVKVDGRVLTSILPSAIENPVSIDTLPTRQLVVEFYQEPGEANRVELHALHEFLPVGPACADHDPQYILVARDGYYRIRREVDVVRNDNVIALEAPFGWAK